VGVEEEAVEVQVQEEQEELEEAQQVVVQVFKCLKATGLVPILSAAISISQDEHDAIDVT